MIVSFAFFLFHAPIGAAESKKTATQKSARKKVEIAGKPAAKSVSAKAVAKTRAASAGAAKQPRIKKADAARNVRANDAGSGRKLASNQERLIKKIILVKGKRKVVYQKISLAKIAPLPALQKMQTEEIDPITGLPTLHSHVAFVLDGTSSEVLYEKNAAMPLPIASITKLMTGLVVVEAKQDMNEVLEVTSEDIDRTKFTGSRLPVGARLSRADMLHIALMSSENRAASALGRNYPGGLPAFVAAMNARAKSLGMSDSYYVEPTGLSSQNVASARDLAKLVAAAHKHPVLSQYSTNDRYAVDTGGHMLQYVNSNRLIGNDDWQIELQKTGYITEAGRCLVMQVKIASRPVVMVFLNGKGAHDRFADAGRLKRWLSQKLIANPPTAIKAVRAPG
jgi:D-alanyl-D-alanine endopeptidase (penicillin-binding protein 7)